MEKEKFYTTLNELGEEVTCTEYCEPKEKIEGCYVHCCCKHCDEASKCYDVCDFVLELNSGERNDPNNCEHEWVIERCDICEELIPFGESNYTVINNGKPIVLCENCWKNY